MNKIIKINKTFPQTKLTEFGLRVYNSLVENFSRTYFVGGTVRDFLLGKNIKDIDENTRKAIASVEVDEIKVAGVTVGQTKKVKFWNKNEALNTIAKHLGMLIDRKDITSTIIIKELNALKPAQLKQLAESVN